MFSSALVRLFVCLQAGLYINYFTDLHKIRWKGSTWTNEETIRFFFGNPDQDQDPGIL